MFKESEVICSALKCTSSHVGDPSVKFFLFPKIVEGDDGESRKRRDEWGKIVGGLKKNVSTNVFLCQYHFPANQFKTNTRTSLIKKAMPAFPFGPINPKTDDFCPVGEEHRFKSGKIVFTCCVPGCCSNDSSGVQLLPFPVHDAKIFLEWTKRLKIAMSERPVAYIVNNCRVCLNHFPREMVVYDATGRFERLRPEAVPSLLLDQKSVDGLNASILKRKIAKSISSPVPDKKLKISDAFSITGDKAAPAKTPLPNTKFVFVPVGKDKSPKEICVQDSKGEVSPLCMSKTPKVVECSVDNIDSLDTRCPPPRVPIRFWKPEDFGMTSIDKQKSTQEQKPEDLGMSSIEKQKSTLEGINMEPRVCLERLKFDKNGDPIPEKSPPKRRYLLSSQKSPNQAGSSSSKPTPVQGSSTLEGVPGKMLKKPPLDDDSIIKYVQDVFKPKTGSKKSPSTLLTEPLDSIAGKTILGSNIQIKSISHVDTKLMKPITLNLPNSDNASPKPSYVLINEKRCLSCIEKTRKRGRLLDKGVQADPLEEGDDEAVASVAEKERDNDVINKLLRQNLDVALLKLFNKSKPNAFSNVSLSNTANDEDDFANMHVFASRESMNLLKSAADLCEFNNLKIKMLEGILGKSKEYWSEMEESTIKHVGSLLSTSGLEFFRNVYQKVVQEGIERKKNGDWNISGSDNTVLTGEVKQFAIALLMHSAKAYQSFSQIMNLPHPQVVRSWAVRPDVNPGFSEKAFRLLTDKAYRVGKHSVAFCLSVAHVHLAKDISFDGQQLFGFSDLGYGQLNRDCVREASGALIFYGSAVNQCWKLPLGYCLVDDLCSNTRANLICQYLCRLEAAGVKCIALAAEGSVESYQTFLALGMETDVDSNHYGSFQHPVFRSERVFCYFDVFQVTKLLRDYLACAKSFTSRDKSIEWKYVENIDTVLKQEEDSYPPSTLKMLYKLKFSMVKDPVSINQYLAQAIRIVNVVGSTNTAKFFEKLHYITEVLTSNNVYAEGDLEPVNRDSWQSVFNRISSLANFFRFAKHNGGPCILYTDQKLPFFMAYSNLRSLKSLIKKTMSSKMRINSLVMENFQMIYVNKWLAEIKGDSTNLMTPLQFKLAVKKFMDSFDLCPSSSIKALPKKRKEDEPKTMSVGFSHWYLYTISPLRSSAEGVQTFLTTNVIKNWLKNPTCQTCNQLLVHEFQSDRTCSDKPSIIDDIHKMLKNSELVLLEHEQIAVNEYDNFLDRWANKTINSMCHFEGFKKHGHLFNSVAFGEVCHFTLLVKQLLEAYLKLRVYFLTRQEGITLNLGKKY